MTVIEQLQDGTADAADVYAALGWEIRPHGRFGGHVCRMEGGRCVGLGRVTRDAHDALYLIKGDRREEAVRAAMALNAEFYPYNFTGCPIARRICVIALTRPDLRNPRATPEGT